MESILKEIVGASEGLSTWALTVAGASLLAIVSTSYHRPRSLPGRLPYLLFLPGWGAIGYSLYLGNLISAKYLADRLSPGHLSEIGDQINNLFLDQKTSFLIALLFFSAWLVIYLLTWIFTEDLGKNGGKD